MRAHFAVFTIATVVVVSSVGRTQQAAPTVKEETPPVKTNADQEAKASTSYQDALAQEMDKQRAQRDTRRKKVAEALRGLPAATKSAPGSTADLVAPEELTPREKTLAKSAAFIGLVQEKLGAIRANQITVAIERVKEAQVVEDIQAALDEVKAKSTGGRLPTDYTPPPAPKGLGDVSFELSRLEVLTRTAAADIEEKVDDEKSAKDEDVKKVTIEFNPVRSPAFNWRMLAGVQMTQRDGSFSKFREYLRFDSSERLGAPEYDGKTDPLSWNQVYPFLSAALHDVPVDDGDTDPDNDTTARAASVDFGVEWRVFDWQSSNKGNRGFVGLIGRQGVDTFTGSKPEDQARVNTSYGVGFRIGEHIAATDDIRNPLPFRYAQLTYGDYGQFESGVWTLEGLLRFSEKADTGLFIGVRTIFGGDDHRDDFSFIFGIDDALKFIAPVFEEIGGLFESK